MQGTKFATFADLKAAVSEAREASLRDSRASCGRGGFHQSRGAWFIVLKGEAEPLIGNGMKAWDGTKRAIEAVLEEARKDGATLVSIEGGHDWAATMEDLKDHNYEPYSGEWAVTVWEA